MELTGKAREDFKQFLYKELWVKQNFDKHEVRFKDLPFNMQWGVYVDFFDSQKIHVDALAISDTLDDESSWLFNAYLFHESWEDFESRDKAREKAIFEANKYYNNKEFVFPHDLDKLTKE